MDTYEENNKGKLETYEWDDAWIEFANDAETFRVLYIGDSISRGIRHIINKLADGKARIDNFATSKAVDNPYFLKAIELFVNQTNGSDLILFNNGLHGFHLNTEEYKKYYENIVVNLLNDYPKAELKLVLTTYTKRSCDNLKIVNERNHAVRSIASKHGLEIIDLYAVSYKCQDMLSADGVHMSEDGYNILAKSILEKF